MGVLCGGLGLATVVLMLSASVTAAQDSSLQMRGAPSVTPSGASVPIPEDLSLLVGKRLVVGRLPLCTPKTYIVNLTYAGKTAKVVSFARNSSLDAVKPNLRRMPPSAQATMNDLMNGGLILFEFEDGTRLDNCGPIGFSTIAAQIELAPGESIAASSEVKSSSVSTLEQTETLPLVSPGGAQTCPLIVTGLSSGISFAHVLVEALTTSEFQRQVDETIHSGQSKHYLDVRVHNNSQKVISAFEFGTLYLNKMGDETTIETYIPNNPKFIDPEGDSSTSAMDRDMIAQTGPGQVKAFITRVKFQDGSIWHDNGTRSCSKIASIK
jgi:hypothetical protein